MADQDNGVQRGLARGRDATPRENRQRTKNVLKSPATFAAGVTQRRSVGGGHVLTAELMAGLLIVLIRAVADYEPQADGTVKGKIGHPKGQYGPLPIAAGLIASFFVLSFVVSKGGRWATVGNTFGALIIITLAVNSVDEFDAVAKTFGNWGKAKKPPGHWETSGAVAGQPVTGNGSSSGGGSGSGAPLPVPKSGKCPPGYTRFQGKCWPNKINPEPM